MLKRLLTLITSFAVLTVMVGPAQAQQDDNITICHATASNTNPYNQQSVDASSITNLPNGHDTHENDIIPPFGTYPGKNWDAAGQAIWGNDCNVPSPSPSVSPTPTHTVTPTPKPDRHCKWACCRDGHSHQKHDKHDKKDKKDKKEKREKKKDEPSKHDKEKHGKKYEKKKDHKKEKADKPKRSRKRGQKHSNW